MVFYYVEGIISTDGKGRIVQVNNDALNLTGWLSANVLGKMLGEVFCVSDKVTGKQIDLFSDINFEDTDIVNNTMCVNLKCGEGESKLIRLKTIPVRNKGKLISLVLVFNEITLDKDNCDSDFQKLSGIYIDKNSEIEEKIKKIEHLFNTLVENDTDFVAMIDEKGKILYTSPSFTKIMGYPSEKRKGENTFEIIHPLDKEKAIELFNNIIKNKDSVIMAPIRIKHADGSWHWIEGFAKNLLDDSEIQAVVLNFKEITKTIEAEHALNYSYELLKYIIENSNSAIAVHDKELRYIYVSRNYLEQYNIIGNDVIGKNHYDVFPDLPQKWRDVHQRALKGEVINSDMDLYSRDDGSEEWTKWECRPWYEANGSVGGIIVYTQVITEQVKREEELKRERLLLRTLIDNLPVSIYIKDLKGRKVVANKTDVLSIGYNDESELIGKTDLDLFDGNIGFRGYNDDMNVIRNGIPIINQEEYFLKDDGSKRWSVSSKFPITDINGKINGLVGISRDITEQKKDHDTILKLTKSIEQNPLSVIITDLNGIIEYANPRFSEMTGYTFEDVIGLKNMAMNLSEINPKLYEELWQTISSGDPWQGELKARIKDGSYIWEWLIINAIKNENGEIVNYVAIIEDITERKILENELVSAKEKAEENDRLKSSFLANMSHEIRTPLNCILGFTELMADPEIETDQRSEFSKLIMTSGNNLLSVINNVLDISKIESGQVQLWKSIFPAQKVLREVFHEYEKKAKDHKIELKISESMPEKDFLIETDELRLKQVLGNFVSNAIKFTEEGFVEIGLKIGNDVAQFYVKDTGIGIPKDKQKDIFAHFRQVESAYTRKYGGNGLGLAISKSLSDMMGGIVGVESESGKGSTFYFTISIAHSNNIH